MNYWQRGEYIGFVDSDDYIDAHSLSRNMEFLTAHPEVDMLEYPIEVHAGSAEAHMLTFPDETQRTGIFIDWIRRGAENGAGEIVVNSIDTDGVKKGFDQIGQSLFMF